MTPTTKHKLMQGVAPRVQCKDDNSNASNYGTISSKSNDYELIGDLTTGHESVALVSGCIHLQRRP
jgi:hypothetical protein